VPSKAASWDGRCRKGASSPRCGRPITSCAPERSGSGRGIRRVEWGEQVGAPMFRTRAAR
jgi:hypothetical protein